MVGAPGEIWTSSGMHSPDPAKALLEISKGPAKLKRIPIMIRETFDLRE